MLKQGMVLSDRYEIIEKIGTGGMSVVYKAKCTKLERLVAIKVLKDELCLDANVVKKFRVEAQSAASLSHNHIVNIYDVGHDGKIHYIVMELLDGKTLKAYIEEKGQLDEQEALKIAAFICSALEHAHANHIIHRDIKPHNIMITKCGKVKVADFGIARVVNGATIAVQETQTGSVHYISPEQAKGHMCDEKSDLYALGVTLFEMVTGQVPYDADSVVGIAIKHIHDPLPMPSSINPNVSKGVEQIILKATQKNPISRYVSAEKMLKDIKTAQISPEDVFVELDDYDPEAQTIMMTKEQLDAVQDARRTTALDRQDLNSDRTIVISAILSAVVLSVVLFFIGYQVLFSQNSTREILIPEITGMRLESAQAALIARDIPFEITDYVHSETEAIDVVISHEPNGTVTLGKADSLLVALTVSLGRALVAVPDRVGIAYDVATEDIEAAGFEVNRVVRHHAFIAPGLVIEQSHLGMQESGIAIDLVVSIGPERIMVTMPRVLGMTETEAIRAIENAGLTVGHTTYARHELIQKGNIITTTVNPDSEVEKGYVVNLVVSEGIPIVTRKVTIPDLLTNNNKNIGTMRVVMIMDGVETVLVDEVLTPNNFPYELTLEGETTARLRVFLDDSLQYETTIYFEE